MTLGDCSVPFPLKGDWMMATQQLIKGALGLFAALRMAGPALKLIDSAKNNPQPK